MASSTFSNQLYKQSESPLFRVSSELRLQIYREWLISSWTSTTRVHLVLLQKRTDNGVPDPNRPIRSSPCTLVPEALGEASTSRWLHNLNCFKGNNTGYAKEHTYEQSVRNISLILACQRTYTEVLPFLCSTLMFDFPAFAIAAQFIDTIPFQTLNSIRNIHLTNNIPMHYRSDHDESFNFAHWKDSKDWRLICETLQQMQHLRGVRINFTGTIEGSRREKELLQPLENVRVAPNGVFVVRLTTILEVGESCTEYESRPNLPFKIEREEWGRVGQYNEEVNSQPMVHPYLRRRRRRRRMVLCFPIVYFMDLGQLIVDFICEKLLNRPRRAFLSI